VAAEPLEVVGIVSLNVGDGGSLVTPEVEDAGAIRGSLRHSTVACRRGRRCSPQSIVALAQIGGPDLGIRVVQLCNGTDRILAIQIGVVQAGQRPIRRSNDELVCVGTHVENFVGIAWHFGGYSQKS